MPAGPIIWVESEIDLIAHLHDVVGALVVGGLDTQGAVVLDHAHLRLAPTEHQHSNQYNHLHHTLPSHA